jgi:hypothetical protein
VVQQVGLVPTILGMGAIYLAVTLGMFFNPALRQMDVDTQLRTGGQQTQACSQAGIHEPQTMNSRAAA